MFTHLGFFDIITYIQSGNVVFQSDEHTPNKVLSEKIEKAIAERFGFDVPVIVRTAEELRKAVSINPFLQDKQVNTDHLFLTFLKNKPSEENQVKISSFDFSPDNFIIVDQHVFLKIAGKFHKSKLTNNFFESKLKTLATTRNWKTVLKLLELAS